MRFAIWGVGRRQLLTSDMRVLTAKSIASHAIDSTFHVESAATVEEPP